MQRGGSPSSGPTAPNGRPWPREAGPAPGGVGEARSADCGVSRASGEGAEPPGAGSGAEPRLIWTQYENNQQAYESSPDPKIDSSVEGSRWAEVRALLRPAAYPRVLMGARQHRRAIAVNLYLEAERLPFEIAEKIRKRAWRMGQCGSLIRIAQCSECGKLVSGTGEIWSPYPCGARVCSHCERARSNKDATVLVAAMERVPKREGLRLARDGLHDGSRSV